MKNTKITNHRLLTVGILAVCTFFSASTSFTLPASPHILNGQVSIGQTGTTMTVTNSPASIINWGSFSIAHNEITRFVQQSPSSSVLNRVTGGDPSQIYGALQSNGKVFLINQNGILIGPTARIDVNGFIASSLNITDQDFISGRMKFTAGSMSGAVENHGIITTPTGGKVYLIGTDIKNSGIITAPNGDIMLAAGKELLLVEEINPEIAYFLNAPDNQAINLGKLAAESGRIGIYGGIVRQSGVVTADTATRDDIGRIFLKSSKETIVEAGSLTTASGIRGGMVTVQSTEGTTLVSGKIEAKGDEDGGEIRILGEQAALLNGASVDVSSISGGGGTVLFGGDYQGKNPEIQNSKAIYLDKYASIKADAIEKDNGGKVILWSDEITRIFGEITATGGLFSGNGGFVETSSKKHLEVYSAPNTAAINGKGGLWLLDPDEDITIWDSTGLNITSSSPFQPTYYGGSYLDVTVLKNYLETTGDAVVQTSYSGGGGTGVINLNSPLNLTLGAFRTLSLLAGNDINITTDISVSGAPLNLNLFAGYATGTGSVNLGIESPSTINLNGGFFNSNSYTGVTLGDLSGSFPANIVAGRITFNNLTSGNISIHQNSTMQTSSNYINIQNNAPAGWVQNGGTINAGSGSLEIYSSGVEFALGSYTNAETIFSKAFGSNGTRFFGGYIGDSSTKEIHFNTDTISIAAGGGAIYTSSDSINNEVGFSPFTEGKTVGVVAGSGDLLISQTVLDLISSPTLVIGSEPGGGYLVGNINVSGLSWSGGVRQRVAFLASGAVTGDNITSPVLGVISSGQVDLTDNSVGAVAIQSAGGGVAFRNNTGFSVVSVTGGNVNPKTITGVSSNGGNIGLRSNNGDISIESPVNAGVGSVNIKADTGSIYTGSAGAINVFAGSFYADAGGNIGGPQYAFVTQTPLWAYLHSGGSMYLTNYGAVTTALTPITSGGVTSLAAKSPLTIGYGGLTSLDNVYLTAAMSSNGSLPDNLTIDGSVISLNGAIYLKAGGRILGSGTLTAPGGIFREEGSLLNELPSSLIPVLPEPPLFLDPATKTGSALTAASEDKEDEEKEEKKKGEVKDGKAKEERTYKKENSYCN